MTALLVGILSLVVIIFITSQDGSLDLKRKDGLPRLAGELYASTHGLCHFFANVEAQSNVVLVAIGITFSAHGAVWMENLGSVTR